MIAAISWRNVWRNKLRSLVIMLAIAIGLTGGIFAVAMFNGVTEQRLRTAIDIQTSHLQVHAPDFTQNRDARLYLPNADTIVSAIQSDPRVKSVTPRLVATAMAGSANANTGVVVSGIDPTMEKEVSTLYLSMEEGDYFETDRRNQILVSSRTAKKLKIGLNSKVVLTMQDSNGEIVGAAFRVTGIFRTTYSVYDEGNMFVRKADLERIMSMQGIVNEVAVRLHNIEEAESVKGAMLERFPDAEILIWREIRPELAYLTDATWQVNYLILIVILLALAFGILNTMLMAIFERVREIGVLMAVGMSKGRIFAMIILETVFLSLTGAALGMVLSALLVYTTGSRGINLAMFAQGLEAFGLSSVIYPQLQPHFYVNLAIMVIVAAMLSALYPAMRALRLKPVEAIHG